MKNLLLFLMFASAFACTQKIVPNRPDLSNQDFPKIPASKNVSSTINIPISVPISSFREELHLIIPDSIPVNANLHCPKIPLIKGDSCRISGVINLGQISLDGTGSNLQASTPINGSLQFDAWYDIAGSEKGHVDKTLNFDGIANVSSQPTISPNWSIEPNLNTSVQFSAAYLRFGLKVNVKGILQKIANPIANKELEKVGAKFSNNQNLKQYLNRYWQTISAPIALSGDELWLTMTPKEILYKTIDVQNDTINLGVSLVIDAATYIGSKPANIDIGEIPDLKQTSEIDDNFNLNLPVLSNYSALSTILNDTISGNPIDLDDQATITFKQITIFGDTANLYIKTGFNAKRKGQKAKGELYFKATPQLENGILKVSDVDFDIKTKNVLVKSASWILNKKLTDLIESKAHFNVHKEMNKQRLKINEKYGNYETNELSINAVLEEADVIDFNLQKEGIYLQGTAKGKLHIDLNNLQFKKSQ